MPSDENVYIVYVPRTSSASTSDVGAVEWTDYAGRVEALEDEPRLLSAMADVDTDGEPGTVLVKQADGTWATGSVADPLEMDAGTVATRFGPVTIVQVVRGLKLTQHSEYPFIAQVEPFYGTVGNTVAEGNHTHALPTVSHAPFAPQGYLSSGTRQLQSRNVVLPANTYCLVEAWVEVQIRGAEAGPCEYRLSVTIDGNTRWSPSGNQGFWGVQGVPNKDIWRHERVLAGTGGAISVSTSVAWGSGGLNTDAGDLVVRVTPQR